MKKKRILIGFLADPSASPRPRQMIRQCLSAGHAVSLYCLPSTIEGVEKIFPICKNSREWQWKRKVGIVASSLLYFILRTPPLREKAIRLSFGFGANGCPFSENRYDAVIIQDLFLLPYILKHTDNCPVLFDAREFYPKQREGNILFDLFEKPLRDWICRTYLPRCKTVFTVSDGLAQAYKTTYGIDPTVLRSTPPFRKPIGTTKKKESQKIRLVHIGVANPNRRIERMIETFCRLSGHFHFDLYLVGKKSYLNKLRQLTKGVNGINLCDPVAPKDILNTIGNYDVGFYYLEPRGFNLTHSLPNKFFEFIQARLAVAIGPSPEMKTLVEEFSCGFVAPEFTVESMAKTLDAITPESLQSAKAGSERAAEALCAEKEWEKVDHAIAALDNERAD
jgi:hypothetical protein